MASHSVSNKEVHRKRDLTFREIGENREVARVLGERLQYAAAMESHVKTLAILHIVFGGLGLLLALGMLLLFGGIAGLIGISNSPDNAHFTIPAISAIGLLIFCFLLALALPGIIAGFGLLRFRPWARILTIVLSVLDLFHVPFGTALGVYGLWVLLSQDTERLFRRAS